MNSNGNRNYFTARLLEWYRRHHRKLPWRESKNPYHIWISEVMLQQTRVETVIPYYERFLEKFPTIEALAGASEAEVLKAWEGLGYYSRARNLQAAVREVHERYGGTVPRTKEDISSLKGVGPYTAGAILSIAYNIPEPAVDGNVMRVLSRYFLIREDITKNSTRKMMESLAKELIPKGQAGDFNQALMELGALVCTPRSPSCLTCPVMEHCMARIEGEEERLPVKKKAKPPKIQQRVVAFIRGEAGNEGKFLVRRRPAQGLLANMWELPHYETPPELSGKRMRDEELMRFLRHSILREEGYAVEPCGWMMDAEHTFSHIQWNMKVYECRPEAGSLRDAAPLPSYYRWVDRAAMESYAFPNVFLRIIEKAEAMIQEKGDS